MAVGQDLFRIEPGEKGAAPPPPKEEAKPEESKPAEKAPEPQAPKRSEPAPQVKATEKPKQPEPSKEKPAPAPKQAASAGNRGETRVKMNRMRQTIAKRLKESQNAAASLTTFNEIDMSALMALRKKYKDEVLKSHDVKLGYMSAFAKAACLALKEIPAANAYIEVCFSSRVVRISVRCNRETSDRERRLSITTTSISAWQSQLLKAW